MVRPPASAGRGPIRAALRFQLVAEAHPFGLAETFLRLQFPRALCGYAHSLCLQLGILRGEEVGFVSVPAALVVFHVIVEHMDGC